LKQKRCPKSPNGCGRGRVGSRVHGVSYENRIQESGVRSQESVIFILGGGDSAMTPVVKIGVMSAQHRYNGYTDKYE
jgi:hypothetical protein